MWQSNTLKGLDEAISELHKTIESLPESSTKKGLLNRFGKLNKVREKLEPTHSPQIQKKIAHSLLLLAAIFFLFALIWQFRKSFFSTK
ncbi:MAG: hypothetical protein HQM08_12050 [Candidatus Riflebacteria bacterium]|nr:hypothetical protein [Candidatus Riflebacteria bacterium]